MNFKTSQQDEIDKGLRSMLSNPFCYNLFGRLVGVPEKYKMYIGRFLKPFSDMKILDIGCGTSAILDYLPLNIQYTGYDMNRDYIKYTKKKYGHRAKFYNQRVKEIRIKHSERYDVVLADGLLHHLNNDEAKKLFHIGYNLLKDEGFMLTLDPAFINQRNFINKIFIALDRGQHVRRPNEYKQLAQSSFKFVELNIFKRAGILPMMGCVIKCKKK